ncbi:MAG: ATP-binding cassette domain-containing protein [Spirochaetes bacterium]|jgi:peptide/nickel transport system ATP-binding protein|nr:ATP-binding cassette domain-containing protein [Spirochaetota bacterium]
MPMIDVRGLEVRFHSRGVNLRGVSRAGIDVLKGVNLSVRKNASLGLVGPSGCGKTTLCRAIAARIVPTAGTVAVAGTLYARANRIEVPSAERARTLQVVGQNPESSFDPRSRVFDAVEEPLRIHRYKQPAEVVERVLADVGLHRELWWRRPRELSGGQLQRVAIARALVLEPSVLLLDEPTSMLDVSIQARVLEILRRLRSKQGITMILVTHDLELASSFCDNIAVMHDGTIVESDTVEQLIRTPNHPFSRKLVEAFRTALPVDPPNRQEVLNARY